MTNEERISATKGTCKQCGTGCNRNYDMCGKYPECKKKIIPATPRIQKKMNDVMDKLDANLSHQQKAKLEATIRNALPDDESRQLKFGCRMKNKNNSAYKSIIWCSSSNKTFCTEAGARIPLCHADKYYRILGRDLTLQDILVALENKFQHKASTGDFLSVKEEENDILVKENYNVQQYFAKVLYLYNLLKPYHKQPEELYVFLYSLLCDE